MEANSTLSFPSAGDELLFGSSHWLKQFFISITAAVCVTKICMCVRGVCVFLLLQTGGGGTKTTAQKTSRGRQC